MRLPRTVRWPGRAMVFAALALLLSACAQSPVSCPGDSATALRVVVRFQEPVADADASTLQRLQSLSQGCAQAVSSLSPTLHVYRFTGVDGLPLLRQRLLAWSAVRDVQTDHAVQNKAAP